MVRTTLLANDKASLASKGASVRKNGFLAIAVTVATLMAGLVQAPSAQALCTPREWEANAAYCQQVFQDESDNWAQFSRSVCNMVGQEPTPHGIWAANSYFISVNNVKYSEMQEWIGSAIYSFCPEYYPIYEAYRSRYP